MAATSSNLDNVIQISQQKQRASQMALALRNRQAKDKKKTKMLKAIKDQVNKIAGEMENQTDGGQEDQLEALMDLMNKVIDSDVDDDEIPLSEADLRMLQVQEEDEMKLQSIQTLLNSQQQRQTPSNRQNLGGKTQFRFSLDQIPGQLPQKSNLMP